MPSQPASDTEHLAARLDLLWLGVALAGLGGGLALWAGARPGEAALAWTLGVAPVLAVLGVRILRSLARGDMGLDIVAALSMTAALVFDQHLAAAVVAVMYAGGTVLESFAEGRARRELHALLGRVPRTATRHGDGGLQAVPLDAVEPGDLLLIRPGEGTPVDGTLESDRALLDQAALTGESVPVERQRGAAVMSGATNAGGAFDLRARARAADSTYAGIVRLVTAAQASRAPMARMADRYALGFLGVTLAIAGAAWGISGDPIRAVAVLVIATPCPLILAVPVALVAGVSRAARVGVLVKGAAPLEALAGVRTLILDKTGTLTDGRPQITAIVPQGPWSEAAVLGFAAALDQASAHPVAQAVVAAARARGIALAVPEGVVETPGEGVCGTVGGHRVVVGGAAFVAARTGAVVPVADAAGSVIVAVAVDGAPAGHLAMADVLRPGTAALLAGLRDLGIRRILLATGDRREVAEAVTRGLGLDGVHADMTPDQKLRLVAAERPGGPVMMVGDGVNDAPALAAADVGVAMGARGAAATVEAADVVLLVDDLTRVASGIDIAQRARRIARQSVLAGIGLSVLGMIAAALGYLSPVQGALAQEVIDIGVILNALRVLGIAPRGTAANRS